MANKENLKAVVAALRSGEYKQGTGALKSTSLHGAPAHCCLGVACDVSGLGKWSDAGAGLERYTVNADTCDHCTGYLPTRVGEWLGFNVNGDWKEEMKSLALLNDSGASFLDIADRLEERYLDRDDEAVGPVG